MMMVFSPSAFASTQARRDLPTRREISWVRPPGRPLTDSRSPRVLVARGSMAYSAVTQPSPLPRRHRGTSSVALAAHSTRVAPNSMSTEPSACSSQPRVILISRSSPALRPSGRDMGESLAPIGRCSVRAGPIGRRPGAGRSAGGAIGGAGLNPLVHPAHALGERGGRPPAQLAGGTFGGDGAALQLAGARRGEHRPDALASHDADDGDQVEHAHLDAGADVPGPRAAAV